MLAIHRDIGMVSDSLCVISCRLGSQTADEDFQEFEHSCCLYVSNIEFELFVRIAGPLKLPLLPSYSKKCGSCQLSG